MARTYILRNLTDGKGRPLANVWTRAYNATTGALTETQYTDSSGTCTFTALPEDANVNICATWGLNSKWFYSIFSATQDLLYLSVTDAVIGTCSISKLTVGNLAVAGTLTSGGSLKSTNYVADTAGWQVDYLGNAEFNSVKVRGSIYTSSIVSDNTLTVSGTLSAGAGGILLDTSGIEVIGDAQMIRFFATAPTGTPRAFIQNTSELLYITTNTGVVQISSAGDLWLTAVGKIFASAATAIDFANIAYIDLPRFTFAGTPATSEGRFGYNLTGHVLQYHNGTSWKVVATV